MDVDKIGGFLKELRREKGLTQEQLAERLSVSGRTVSRWETGRNMPDLSILIQLAEFYDVEMKEILDGERRSVMMDKELKDMLCKVADYSKLEKEKAAKAGNTAFGMMFVICTATIVIQLAMNGKFAGVAGETAALLAGGAVYIGIMIYHGVWETGSRFKSTPFRDLITCLVCSGIFTVVLVFCYIRLKIEITKIVCTAVFFFIGIAILSFSVLRIFAYYSSKRKNLLKKDFDE